LPLGFVATAADPHGTLSVRGRDLLQILNAARLRQLLGDGDATPQRTDYLRRFSGRFSSPRQAVA
jgi:hypothetical protein